MTSTEPDVPSEEGNDKDHPDTTPDELIPDDAE